VFPECGTLPRTVLHAKPGVFIGKTKKPGRLWTFTGLSVVPEAAPKDSPETRMNARSGVKKVKMCPQMCPQTVKDTPP
jgi:hypothetical protein